MRICKINVWYSEYIIKLQLNYFAKLKYMSLIQNGSFEEDPVGIHWNTTGTFTIPNFVDGFARTGTRAAQAGDHFRERDPTDDDATGCLGETEAVRLLHRTQ